MKPISSISFLFVLLNSCLCHAFAVENKSHLGLSLGSVEIFDEQAKLYLDSTAKISLLANGFKWTEGPLWLEKSQTLLFSDIPNNKIYQYQDNTGVSEYLAHSGATGLFKGDYLQGSNG